MHAFRTLLLVALLGSAGAAHARRADAPGQFDYYAVALSWSPSYCATSGGRDPDQCGVGRKLGFVLHGLWPQHEAGYPESCSNQPVPNGVRNQYQRIYPSPKLLGHEWRKHGTCSGLDPAAYFALSATLKESLVIPAQFRQPANPVRVTPGEFVQAFKQVNPGMARDSVLPFCSGGGRFLRELHACYAKDGRSRSCSNGEIKRSYSSCRQGSFLLESVR